MNISRSTRYVLYASAAAIFAGCSSGPVGSGSNPTTFNPNTRGAQRAQVSTSTAFHQNGVYNPDTQKSWISPELSSDKKKTKSVLFVTDDGTNDVFILRLPTLKLVGTLTGFSEPQGECTDKSGDVWVTNTGTQQILKYSHTGELKNTLNDSIGNPVGCAWDATTGNLAVTDINGQGSNVPAIEVYTHASGSPHQYRNSSQGEYFFAGYDTKGNLFIDGISNGSPSGFILSELPKGATQAHTVQIIGGTIVFPGMVQWDATGNYVAVGDQDCTGKSLACIYRVSINHNSGSITGKTKLNNFLGKFDICDLDQGYLDGSQLFGSDIDGCGAPAPTEYAWPFPKGGNPTVYNDTFGGTEPIGAAVSK